MRRRVVDNFRNKLRWWAVGINPLSRFATALPKGEPSPASHSGRGGCVQPERVYEILQPMETFQETSLQKDNKIGMLSKLRSVLTSYLAYSSKANSFRIVQKTLSQHKWIDKIFKISGTKAAFSEEITQEQKRIVFGFY